MKISRQSRLILGALLLTTALCRPAYAEFDPNEGKYPLPNLQPLTERTHFMQDANQRRQPIVFPPLNNPAPLPPAIDPAPPTNGLPPAQAAVPPPSVPQAAVNNIPTVEQAPQTAPPATVVAAPVPLPAVDAPVPMGLPPPPPMNTVAPPVSAAVTPIVPPAYVEAPPAPASPAIDAASPAAAPLSRESKKILSSVPSKLDTAAAQKASKIALSRVTPKSEGLAKDSPVDVYEGNGISISVHRPGLDTNFELNRAYTALSGGDSEAAIEVYKNILSTEPANQDALFGLASLYHRQGQLEKARPIYGTLLKHYPNHRDGLNNFLALVSEESPQEALAELERLEQRNPDFSPIPAQEAILLNKLGYYSEAREKMLRAIELAPDNLTYKYNLAIMLDSQKDYEGASALYRLLINASDKGEKIPATTDTLQKRLNYIATLMTTNAAKS